MTTEEEARTLLGRAAATVEVDPTVPGALVDLAEPRARRWPVLAVAAAAAAVVVAVGGGALVAARLGDGPAGGSRGDDTTAADDPPPLDPDQLLDLIGYTKQEALALLERQGYDATVRVVPDGCDVPGIVTGTSPPVGTRMHPGDPVTLRVVGEQAVIDCVGEVPWRLVWDVVRFARGLTDRPDTLAGADLGDDAMKALAQDLGRSWPGLVPPRIVAHWSSTNVGCRQDPLDAELQFWVEVPTDGVFCPSRRYGLEIGPDGRVRSVRMALGADDAVDQAGG